jgi:hypothetical protein
VALKFTAEEWRGLPAARIAGLLAAEEDQVFVWAGAGFEVGCADCGWD